MVCQSTTPLKFPSTRFASSAYLGMKGFVYFKFLSNNILVYDGFICTLLVGHIVHEFNISKYSVNSHENDKFIVYYNLWFWKFLRSNEEFSYKLKESWNSTWNLGNFIWSKIVMRCICRLKFLIIFQIFRMDCFWEWVLFHIKFILFNP